MLPGSDVITRVALAMALSVAPWTRICGGSSANDGAFDIVLGELKSSITVVMRGTAGEGANDGCMGDDICGVAFDSEAPRVCPDLPDVTEAVSEVVAGMSSDAFTCAFVAGVGDGVVGLRIEIPRFPKTLLADLRLLLTCLDPMSPLGIGFAGGSLLASGGVRFPFTHQCPIQSPIDDRSC